MPIDLHSEMFLRLLAEAMCTEHVLAIVSSTEELGSRTSPSSKATAGSFYLHRMSSSDLASEVEHTSVPDTPVAWVAPTPNWSNVTRALRWLAARGRFPITVVANTDWPYGRRDRYESQDSIPEAERLPSTTCGLVPGDPEPREKGGLFAGSEHAIYEGTLRNGARTAVEDFVSASDTAFDLIDIPGAHGCLVLVPAWVREEAPEALDAIHRLRPTDELAEWTARIERRRLDAEVREADARAEAEVDRERFSARIAELEAELEESRTKHEQDREHLARLQQTLHDDREKLARRRTRNRRLRRALDLLHVRARAERHEAEARAAAVERDAAERAAKHEKLRLEADALRDDLLRATEESQRLEESLRRATLARAESEDATAERQELRTKLEAARRRVRQLEARDPEAPRDTKTPDTDPATVRKLAQLSGQFRELQALYEELRTATRRILQSKRFRLGHAIGEWQRRLLRKKRSTLPQDFVFTALERYDAWARRVKAAPACLDDSGASSDAARNPSSTNSPTKGELTNGLPAARTAARVAVQAREESPVSILVYSAGDTSALRDTLASIRRCTDTDRHSVIVLDDSARPRQPEHIRALARGITNLRVASQPESAGRLAAVTAGVRSVERDDVCLLHEGVVVTPGWLEALQACASRVGNAGAVSPLTPSTSYSAVSMQPGDTIASTSRKLQLLSRHQAPTTAIPDLDVVLLRRRMLECVELPEPGSGDYHLEMSRMLLAAHDRELRCVIADDTFVFVPTRLQKAASRSSLAQHLTQDENRRLEDIEAGSDCPEVDVLESYEETELTLVPAQTAVFLIDPANGHVPSALVRLMNDLVLRGIEVRAVECRPAQWPETVECLFRPIALADDDFEPRDGSHVFATSRATAFLAARWRDEHPKLEAYDLLLDVEARAADIEHDAETIETLKLGLHMLTTTEWSRKEIRFLTKTNDVSVRKIPYGIALESFYPPETAPTPTTFRILARLSGRSSDETILAACERLHARDPELHVTFYGAAVDIAGLPFPCISLGRLDSRARCARLHEADVAIDLRAVRSLAVSGLEAMACGVPVVMTNCGGTAEFLRHDHNGWLVEPGNVDDLIEALQTLREDPERRARLRNHGLQTTPNYGRDRIAAEIEYLIGTHEVRRKARVRKISEDITTNIIIPIYNELEYVRLCLESILEHTTYPYRVYMVDDGSDSYTKGYLRDFAARHEAFHLIENEQNLGFVQSCNRGMAATPSGDILLLNSDVIVTPDWLRKIVRCAYSDEEIGIVSPLSTRSSHLWIKINPGDSIFRTAEKIEELSDANYPDIVTPEGWCFFVRRDCYEHLGGFDSVFGKGYCEESDYSMRALANGYRTVCADDTFVFHKGRVTFKGERGPRYKHNRKIFDRRWKAYYQKLYREFLDDDPLGTLRARYAASRPAAWLTRDEALPLRKKTLRQKLSPNKGVLTILDDKNLPAALDHYRERMSELERGVPGSVPQKVTFVLSTLEKYGGVISVTQLANDLVLHGVETRIVVLNPKRYADDIFVLTEPIFFADTDSMVEHFPRECNVVATLWITLYYIALAMKRHPDLVPYYFIQDYEPLFIDESQPELRERVIDTYRLPARRFAKTRWIIDQVAQHDALVHKVPPGLDLDVFYPRDVAASDRTIVLVMMRPKTARRGFDMIQRVFPKLVEQHPNVEIHAFGTDDEDLASYDIDFPFVNHGHMSARDLPALYSRADIYADLSSFQGFGRTGLEAMACGAACLLTDSGGVNEYAVDGENCLLVDPHDADAILEGLSRLIEDEALRERFVAAGRETIRPFEKTHSSLETWKYLSDAVAPDEADRETREEAERTPVG